MISKWLKKIIDKLTSQSMIVHVICFEIILIIVVAFTTWFVYKQSTDQIYEQNEKYVNDIADRMVNGINTHLISISNIMYATTYNRDIYDLLDDKGALETFYITRKLDAFATQMSNDKQELKRIIVMGTNGVNYNMSYDNLVADQIRNLNNKVKKSTSTQYIGRVNMDEKYYLMFGNSIYSFEKAFNKIGNVLVLIEESIFTDKLSSESGNFYIIDSNRKIIAGKDKEKNGEYIDFNEVKVMRQNWYIKDMDLKLVGINTDIDITKGIRKTGSLYSIVIGMMLFMVIMTYLFFINYAVKPLHKINQFISIISQGDLRYLKKRIDINGAKEITNISKEINLLLDEVNLLTGRLVTTTTNLYDAELSKKKAELSFLKSQINPHFLYNTLGTIKGIAIMHDEKEIELMTSALVKIFRYSIKGEDYVELFEEIKVVEAYIHIQQHRFINRFEVEYDIEEHLWDMPIIKMILQPILENAIVHGIEPVERKCVIKIIAAEDEQTIKISVKDDGVGISENKLKSLQQQLSIHSLQKFETEHIGIINVHRRLRYAYGDEAGIYIMSEEGKGTNVCLTIPSDRI